MLSGGSAAGGTGDSDKRVDPGGGWLYQECFVLEGMDCAVFITGGNLPDIISPGEAGEKGLSEKRKNPESRTDHIWYSDRYGVYPLCPVSGFGCGLGSIRRKEPVADHG